MTIGWGVFGWRGSNFLLSHKLWSSPLQHSRTTVRVCDTRTGSPMLQLRHLRTKDRGSSFRVEQGWVTYCRFCAGRRKWLYVFVVVLFCLFLQLFCAVFSWKSSHWQLTEEQRRCVVSCLLRCALFVVWSNRRCRLAVTWHYVADRSSRVHCSSGDAGERRQSHGRATFRRAVGMPLQVPETWRTNHRAVERHTTSVWSSVSWTEQKL